MENGGAANKLQHSGAGTLIASRPYVAQRALLRPRARWVFSEDDSTRSVTE